MISLVCVASCSVPIVKQSAEIKDPCEASKMMQAAEVAMNVQTLTMLMDDLVVKVKDIKASLNVLKAVRFD